jgi:hypothetical protein
LYDGKLPGVELWRALVAGKDLLRRRKRFALAGTRAIMDSKQKLGIADWPKGALAEHYMSIGFG